MMAIFMLSVFCAILLGEMAQGNLASCGCLGAHSPPPWVMLLIDGSLLFGVIMFDPSPILSPNPPKWPLGLAVVLAVAGMGYSWVDIMNAKPVIDNGGQGTNGNGGTNGEQAPTPTVTWDRATPTINASPKPAPPYWFTPSNVDAWKGKPFHEIELFQFMGRWPKDMLGQTRYVVFYSRTCDHCEEMFYEDLSDPGLGAQTTTILVPGKDARIPASAWEMPPTDCEHLELPFGTDWIISTPLALRLVDGVIEDVNEGDHRPVMGLE